MSEYQVLMLVCCAVSGFALLMLVMMIYQALAKNVLWASYTKERTTLYV